MLEKVLALWITFTTSRGVGDAQRQKGATAVEYAILVSLIAVVIVVAVTLLGVRTSSLFNNAANSLP